MGPEVQTSADGVDLLARSVDLTEFHADQSASVGLLKLAAHARSCGNDDSVANRIGVVLLQLEHLVEARQLRAGCKLEAPLLTRSCGSLVGALGRATDSESGS
jgi:hypothetical protein